MPAKQHGSIFSTWGERNSLSVARQQSLDHLNDGLNDSQKTAVKNIMKNVKVHDHEVTVIDDSIMRQRSTQLASSLTVGAGSNGQWIKSTSATVVFGSVVILNIVTIGVQADAPLPDAGFGDISLTWFIIESCFNLVFLLELSLNLRADGFAFFRRAANLLDVCIVLLGVIDTWVVGLVLSTTGDTLRFVGMFRVLRLLRLLRILRLFRFCDSLWAMIYAMWKSFSALGWVVLLTLIVCYIVAVILRLTLGVSMYEKLDGDELDTAKARWGSVPESMFTLFVCMTGEAWYDIALEAVAVEGWLYVVFLPFMCLTNLMLVNVIIGIMCERIAEEHDDEKRRREQQADEKTIEALAVVFCSIDVSSCSSIDIDQLLEGIEDDVVIKGFRDLHISLPSNVDQMAKFFDRNHDGEIGFQEFVQGCMKLKYSGAESETWFLRHEVKDYSERILQLLEPDSVRPARSVRSIVAHERSECNGLEQRITAAVAQAVEGKLREERKALRMELSADFKKLLEGATGRSAKPLIQHAPASPQSTSGAKRNNTACRGLRDTHKVPLDVDGIFDFNESTMIAGRSEKVDVQTAAASLPTVEHVEVRDSSMEGRPRTSSETPATLLNSSPPSTPKQDAMKDTGIEVSIVEDTAAIFDGPLVVAGKTTKVDALTASTQSPTEHIRMHETPVEGTPAETVPARSHEHEPVIMSSERKPPAPRSGRASGHRRGRGRASAAVETAGKSEGGSSPTEQRYPQTDFESYVTMEDWD